MGDSVRVRRDRAHLSQEEAILARRAAAGDRSGFDTLFDRYYTRVTWYFRDLPRGEAHAAIWQTLEQVFAGLDGDDELAERAYRIARR